jgi:hypothetical protein
MAKEKKKASEPKKRKSPAKALPTPAPDVSAGDESGPVRKKSPARKRARKAPVIEISRDDIALRAYYLAERRHRLGHPGDETSDWIEAERQLREEAGR